ncbi:MAG: Alanine-tRNA ligase [Candidatus Nomurabacteria bacterium GW2011_GWD2_36_14]|nr:MAG: Alanine-tRNA ligase [Candidatus Nomurabacteria bacterium GW2011_GWE2_36_115]KKP94156.1 MAG: Alanine-tRNA ligase [Candidatus Nomurabacteria bacterium GW2011_GWF2_36_126]KKP96716.1 MAG: Alanine-tRNA ligase [Candidatus Nomurabacteria bacterium GW2011_GWD2_36_14]KKP99680.1 MAG: Alanine-tRNA ligase [Candidatus Nomurabacteria bacterium GW2011_GWF2_36_19]KKQ05375.1 MAG: Alanine-tRNA ligase [Candidatus Nomurabacteria bacterium GW2011_GWF1_36_47]KKQ09054.1 MAG: Alanine-tRNA ligase [Candidatus N
MTSNEIRQKFLKFFESREHKIIPSASLIPENDPSVLFNTAGMQPIVPYLLGQKHPMGTRLVDVQKCVRTGDIDEVGDNRHLTFFEMLGNWSLGDYFKPEAIQWSFEFLTDKEEGLGLDINRIYVTVFEGNDDASRDIEAFEIWKKYLPEGRIYFLPAKNNWWSAGDNGPCGPDTEIFYDPNESALGDMTHDEFVKADDEGRVIEVWNNVFMQYEKKEGKVIGKLAQHNVDTGMGLERITMVCQKVKTVFDTDLFTPIISKIEELSNLKYGDKTDEEYIKEGDQCWVDTRREIRIVADHIRTAIFMIGDGATPSNAGAGYVLRRIIRRTIRFSDKLGLKSGSIDSLLDIIIEKYKGAYPELEKNKNIIKDEIKKEENKFRQTLEQGLKEFERGTDPFDLYQSYGFPVELTEELAKEKGIKIDRADFDKKLKEHQELSRTSSAGMFKGGLANHSDKTVKLHTAHHLLLAALQNIVSKDIKQRGSNITEERLRMDFMCDHKLTDEEKKEVEDWVNDKIKRGLNVVRKEMPLVEAEKIGAEMEFGAKYPEVVSLYFIEDENGNAISKEFCGGPHVSNTSELGYFKIQKEEASSAGVRRIKAVLE